MWASTVGNSLFNTRATCPEKKKIQSLIVSGCRAFERDVRRCSTQRKKLAAAILVQRDILRGIELNFLANISFFRQINMTACHVRENHPLFKKIELCHFHLNLKGKSQKVRVLLSRQNNRQKWFGTNSKIYWLFLTVSGFKHLRSLCCPGMDGSE